MPHTDQDQGQTRARLEFFSSSENIGFARNAAALYASRLDFTLLEIEEIKTAVSEAVSNCVIHGYPDHIGPVVLELGIHRDQLWIRVEDWGVGIADVEWARQPTHTSLPDEHMGLGFAFMEQFSDEMRVDSREDEGTTVLMKKKAGTDFGGP